ncbi:MAG: DUF4097 family beta strand repeat protein [Ruminiclostridium sp.]|nr:DUF4097 family beta strand repeat protein [Ruminiclostridium sp.]
MRRGKKIALWAAGILILLGAVLGTGAVLLGNLTLEDMNTQELVTETVTITEEFQSISINDSFSNIYFLPSEDGTCKIVYQRLKQVTYTAEVEGDTLTIQGEDGRKWYEMIWFGSGSAWGELEMAVYLPETQYGDLIITSGGGDLNIPSNFVFDVALVVSASGDVTFRGAAERSLTLQTASGDILAENVRAETMQAATASGTMTLNTVTVGENLVLDSSSGDLDLTNVECGELTANSSSGSMDWAGVLVWGTLRMDTASGDIRLMDCDASALYLSSSSGDISGTLKSEKVFQAHSDSGDVNVPHSVSGGLCEIHTSSGNIHFEEFGGIIG